MTPSWCSLGRTTNASSPPTACWIFFAIRRWRRPWLPGSCQRTHSSVAPTLLETSISSRRRTSAAPAGGVTATRLMRYLLDTNAISEPFKRSPDPGVSRWLTEQSPLDLCISVLTLGELTVGVELAPAGKRREELQRWVTHDLAPRF